MHDFLLGSNFPPRSFQVDFHVITQFETLLLCYDSLDMSSLLGF